MAKKPTLQPNPTTIGITPRKPAQTTTIDPPKQPDVLKPKPEQTPQQNSMFNGPIPFLGGLPGMPGMVGSSPLAGAFYGAGALPVPAGMFGGGASPFYNGFGAIGVNGFGTPYGTFANYWLMERNPTLALAEATADAPIRAAELTYESREGTPQEVVDFIREVFQDHERELLHLLSHARGWGFRPVECVYKIDRKGRFVYDKSKGLMPDLTQAFLDEHGNLVGLNNQGVDLMDTRRFLWLTYDGKGCNVYGRSRKENCKKPWLREEGLYDLLEYSMNIQVRPFGYVSYPYGVKVNGEDTSDQCKMNAVAIAQNMASGQWATVPNIYAPWMEELVGKGIDPSKIEPYKIGWYNAKTDSGDGFERIFGITNRGIVMGILQPPRTILEGPGTQADASQHTDTAIMVNEAFLSDLCRCVNRGPIDTVLVQNYGEDYRGAVWWQPAPMVDKQLQFNNDLVKSILGSDLGPFLLKRVVNIANVFEKAGVKIGDFDQEKLAEDADKAAQEKQAMELQSKQPMKASMDEGSWITIDGTHVHIDGSGKIDKGPSHMVGKSPSNIDGKKGEVKKNAGWKLHINVPADENHPTTKAVSEHLKSKGIPHKIGRSGDQVGKGVTAYVGAKDDAEIAAADLHNKFGNDLGEPGHDVLKDDQKFMGNVYGRFDAIDKEFHQYGVKGVPHLMEDAGPYNDLPTHIKTQRAEAKLKSKFGEFYTGSKWYKQKNLSLADDLVDPEHRLTEKERKRRKQFLLLLLAFFAWQYESLAMSPELKADDPKFNVRLTEILAKGMFRGEKYLPEITKIAADTAAKVNATTAKNIQTLIGNGSTPDDAAKEVTGKGIESRAESIEGDMSHVAEQIEKEIDAKENKQQLVWRTEPGACQVCSPLDGIIFNAGEEVIQGSGIRWPVVDTHGHCRCTVEPVPIMENPNEPSPA